TLTLSSRSPLIRIRARANPANLGTTCQLQQLIQGNGLSLLRTACSEEPDRRCPARVAELQPDALSPRFGNFIDAALKRKAQQSRDEYSAEDGPADYIFSWVNVIRGAGRVLMARKLILVGKPGCDCQQHDECCNQLRIQSGTQRMPQTPDRYHAFQCTRRLPRRIFPAHRAQVNDLQ